MRDVYTAFYHALYGEVGTYRLTTDTTSRGRESKEGVMRKVNAARLPLTLYIDGDTVTEVRNPSMDLDPDNLFLGGSVYYFTDDDPRLAILIDAGYTVELVE